MFWPATLNDRVHLTQSPSCLYYISFFFHLTEKNRLITKFILASLQRQITFICLQLQVQFYAPIKYETQTEHSFHKPFLLGTNDEYEVGDLSGKYGSLVNLTNYNGKHIDYNLPLFGKNSIQGRSIVIHKTKTMGGMRWVCADAHQMMEGDKMFVMKTKITFTGPALEGYILLVSPFYISVNNDIMNLMKW